jgi:magnesium transporter
MLLDLKFSIGTLGIGAGTFIAGLYGMNLTNFIEESALAFVGVSAWAFVISAVICGYGLHKLRRTQRLSMWGEGGAKGKKGWLSLGTTPVKGKARLPPAYTAGPGAPPHTGPIGKWPPLQVTTHKRSI